MIKSLYADPDLYDAVHAGPNKGELAFYLRRAERAGRRVLELASGTGRLTVPLLQAGLDVTGLDRSLGMLDRARRQAAAVGVSGRWVCADMRDFALGASFDLIFLPINSICHLEANADLEACLQTVRRHLAPGGVFVIDVFNPSLEILTRDPQRWHDLGEYPNEDGRVIRLSERNRYDKASQINAITWRFEWDGHAPVELALRMRQYFPQELDGQVTRAGLRILAKFGNYGEKPFQSDSQQQLIVAGLPPGASEP